MASPRPRIKFTYEDYRNAPEDRRYELLDGELVVVPSPRTSHQRVSLELAFRMHGFAQEFRLGSVFVSPFDVVLSDTDVVQPDILFVSDQRADIITEANVRGAPDLVVEILSPTTADRDRTFKRSLYAHHQVKEYWLVDPDAETVEVLTLGEHGLDPVATYGRAQILRSTVLEDLRLKLSEVF